MRVAFSVGVLLLLAAVGRAEPLLDPAGSSGTIVVSAGELPDAARARFVELAGGAGARIVVIPTASEQADGDGDAFLAPWKHHKVEALRLLHTGARRTADT